MYSIRCVFGVVIYAQNFLLLITFYPNCDKKRMYLLVPQTDSITQLCLNNAEQQLAGGICLQPGLLSGGPRDLRRDGQHEVLRRHEHHCQGRGRRGLPDLLSSLGLCLRPASGQLLDHISPDVLTGIESVRFRNSSAYSYECKTMPLRH